VNLRWTDQAWEDYRWWQRHDRDTVRRINRLIEAAQRDPFHGIGKPEPLKGELSGCWSRRITQEHRLVYTVHDGYLVILQCRYHHSR
jgi:toxin YoeB